MTDTDNYLYEVARRLIGFDTVSAKSDLAAIEYLAKELVTHGFTTAVQPVELLGVSQANLVAWVGPARADGLIISGHVDTVPYEGQPGWTREPLKMASAGTFIYVTDLNAGQLSVLGTNYGALSFSSLMPSNTTGNQPIGIGYATLSSGNFVYTANQGSSSLWSFPLPTAGHPSQPVEFGTGNLNAPTGLVVDPQNAFLYTTNQIPTLKIDMSAAEMKIEVFICFIKH